MNEKESNMNDQESLEFVRNYFNDLFVKRNPDALDDYLDKNYHDDDIGDSDADHIKNSKEFLTELFKARPTIGVDVKKAMAQDNVISAFIEWFVIENNVKRAIMKGVVIFVIVDMKILKRHTYLYYQE